MQQPPNYHGHNYNLIVKVKGEVDPETGYVMDMKVLKDIVKSILKTDMTIKSLFGCE